MSFSIPTKDILYTIEHCTDFTSLVKTQYVDHSPELSESILNELSRFCCGELAPLNQSSDQNGATLGNAGVITSPGFREVYAAYIEGGWPTLSFAEELGGQALPSVLALAVGEATSASALSFSTVTTLTSSAAKVIDAVGSDLQKQLYLPKLVSGEWTATMNLTEPQAGSDLSAIKTKAEPADNGLYKISGQKIYITYGDHDLTDNIVHLVLAKLPDAPPGTNGISMFIVPKYHLNSEGQLSDQNDVQCIGLEEKMGIHGSPTAVMAYGENNACFGTLLGKEHQGLRNMFIMMNSGRLDVGIQGVGVAERGYQRALVYAQERVQGYAVNPANKTDRLPVAIYEHTDVRRMIYTMKVLTEASRAICYVTAVERDLGKYANSDQREHHQALAELLTPIAKAWSTDRANDVTSLGVQVHGGMGYIEETGAAQHMRDARILAIYEGTNGIQSMDLIDRKILRDSGKVANRYIVEILSWASQNRRGGDATIANTAAILADAAQQLQRTTHWLLDNSQSNTESRHGAATAYLKQFGNVVGGYYLAKGALASLTGSAQSDNAENYLAGKRLMADFYAQTFLNEAIGLSPTIMAGGSHLQRIDPEFLSA